VFHPLEQKLVALRRRVRRMAAVYGLSIVAAILLATVAAVGLIDRLLRLEDRGLRIIASLATLGVLAWASYRFLGSTLFVRLRNIDLALRVQRAFPRLKDRLLSAIEFLRQPEDDPTAGSAALRRAVVAQTVAETQDLDFSQALDPRPTRRAAMLLAAASLVATILVLLAPADARVAVVRLINPLGNTAWPRTTQLMVRRPARQVARGESFQVEVVDARGARLPPEVRIHYRDEAADRTVIEETQPMRFVDGVMVARRENVQRSFSYRVEGGDDRSMPWSEVELVEPPAVESLSVRLIPPAYTGWPVAQSQRHIRALVGTEVRLAGQSTAPLASATLCLEGGRKIPAWVGSDGHSFTVGYSGAPFLVEKSGAYWFELTDRDGLHGGGDDRWEIRAIPDAPPSVRIERPSANLFVTARAVVPLRVSAQDDLAIRGVALTFRRGESAAEQVVPLFSGPKQAPRSLPQEPVGNSRVVDYRWDLAALGLQPGTQVTFYATAGDYLPQTGKSEPRRLIVVTPDELQQRIASREKLIVAELQRALTMQRACRSQIESLVVRLAQLPPLEQTDVDHLQAAEHGQREVDQLLTSRSEGVPMHVHALLDDLENNRVDNADARRQMTTLVNEPQRLDEEQLSPLEHELMVAVRTAQADREEQEGTVRAEPGIAAALATAAGRQDAVVAALEQWLRQLTRSDSYRRFRRDIAQLLNDQEDVARRTSAIGRRTLTRELRELLPPDVADLKTTAAGQLELARLLDRVLQEMDQAGAALRQNDPLAADAVADALGEARRLAVAGLMRTAGGQIQENQIGQATAGQKQIAQGLQEIIDILANHRREEAARLVKKLREVEADLAAIDKRQADLQEQIVAAAQNRMLETRQRELEQVAKGQQKLRQETQQIAQRLEWLQADKAAQAVTGAAGQMDQVDRSAGHGDWAVANAHAAEARLSLAEARRRLADAVRQAAAELAFEELARLEDDIKRLRLQQAGALAEAKRLHGLEHSSEQLTRAQAAAIHDLARLQQSLQADAAGLGKRLADAGPFGAALTGAAADMGRAAESLDRRDTGKATQRIQGQIVAKLDALIQQLRQKPGQSSSIASQPEPSASPSPAAPSGPKPSAAAQKSGNKPATATSSRPSGDSRTGKSDAAETRALMKRLWGALPKHAREQMLQLPVEEFPPKYERQIEGYFRRLSEEGREERGERRGERPKNER
jgi:hypothetical protein